MFRWKPIAKCPPDIWASPMLLYCEKEIGGKTEYDFRHVVPARQESGEVHVTTIAEFLNRSNGILDLGGMKNIYVAPVPVFDVPLYDPDKDIPDDYWCPIGAALPPVNRSVLGVYWWGDVDGSAPFIMLFNVQRDGDGCWTTWNEDMTDRVDMLGTVNSPAPVRYVEVIDDDRPTSRASQAKERFLSLCEKNEKLARKLN